MKKLIFLIPIFLCTGILLTLYMNPPLKNPGFTSYEDNFNTRVIEVQNEGFRKISLTKVYINGQEAQKVELGVSRSNNLVTGGGLDDNPSISFHDIYEYQINPSLTPRELQRFANDRDVIKYYGIRVASEEIPEIVTIKYTYLGLPFALEVDLKP